MAKAVFLNAGRAPRSGRLGGFRACLFAATVMAGVPMLAAAGGDDEAIYPEDVEALEARVTRLESKLDKILARMESAGDTLTAEETKTLKAAAALVADGASPRPILVELQTPGGVSAQAAASPAALPAKAPDGFQVGDARVKVSGFVKLDASVTDFSGGELPSANIGRDFYIPALVPVGGQGDGPDFDFNPRETRFMIDATSTAGGRNVGGHIELDFQVTDGGDERVSNSYVPRVRQAYFTIDNWLFGQTWSTFQDVAALPDNLDFIGPTEGTVFIRQPMIRYTRGPWQIALEEPEAEFTSSTGSRVLPGDDIAPDLVIRYNKKGDWGHLAAAGIVRALHVENDAVLGAVEDTSLGYGLSLSGLLKVGEKDDFRFMATGGEGIGRYIGVNIVNDAGVSADGSLKMISTYSGFASYRHFWSDTVRSNLTGGYFRADNPVELVGAGVTDQVYSVHANIIYSPIPKIDVGIEYIYANRRLESGVDGDMNKVQFSTKYSF